MVSIVVLSQLLLACMPEDSGDGWALRHLAPGTEAVEGAPFSMRPAMVTTPSPSCFHIFSPIIMAASKLPANSQGSQMGQKKGCSQIQFYQNRKDCSPEEGMSDRQSVTSEMSGFCLPKYQAFPTFEVVGMRALCLRWGARNSFSSTTLQALRESPGSHTPASGRRGFLSQVPALALKSGMTLTRAG